jgi:cyclopropane fatty-acyl-phospholipid synthase-like methyltransferase
LSSERNDEKPPQHPTELFQPQTGRSYKEFWENVAATKEGAYLGVSGLLFDKPLDDEDMAVDGEAVADILVRELAITQEHKVLEIGVGVGRIAQHVAPRCREFHGVDISANMIRVAQERTKDLPNVRLRALDASSLDVFPEATFDRVYCQIVLIHLDREEVFLYLKDAFRVLKPGGRAWFQTNNLLHRSGWACFQGVANEARAQGQANRGRVHFLTAPELRKYVEGAGFSIDEARSHLALTEQEFGFVVPNLQWDHYLIAVANKPA